MKWLLDSHRLGYNRIIGWNLAFWLVNEAKYLAWNCELKTRLSDIVSHLRNNYRQILTQQLQKRFSTMSFYNVFKTIVTFWRVKNKQKRFFKVSRRSFLVLNWTTNSWRGIKNFFRSWQRESKKILWIRPRKWPAKFQPNKTEKQQYTYLHFKVLTLY